MTPAHAALRTRARFAAGWFPVSDPSPGTGLLLFRAGEQAQAGYAAKDAIVRGNRQAETGSCRGDPPVAVVDFVSERVSDLGGR